MSLTLGEKHYVKLLQEDLDWLRKQPPSLERDHIEVLLGAEIRDQLHRKEALKYRDKA